jgi:hypothetical protein
MDEQRNSVNREETGETGSELDMMEVNTNLIFKARNFREVAEGAYKIMAM